MPCGLKELFLIFVVAARLKIGIKITIAVFAGAKRVATDSKVRNVGARTINQYVFNQLLCGVGVIYLNELRNCACRVASQNKQSKRCCNQFHSVGKDTINLVFLVICKTLT